MFEPEALRRRMGDVQIPAFEKRPSVVDPETQRTPVDQVGDPYQAAERQVPVGRRHRSLVEFFSAGGLLPVVLLPIPARSLDDGEGPG